MTITLHEKLEKRLRTLLIENLPKVLINNNRIIDTDTFAYLFDIQKTMPDKGPLKESLEKYIGDNALYHFIYQNIIDKLCSKLDYDSEALKKPLSDYEDYKGPEEFTEELIDELKKLPIEYHFTIRLPETLGSYFLKISDKNELSQKIRIAKGTDQSILKLPYEWGGAEGSTLLGGLLDGKSEGWDENACYLQIDKQGFVGTLGNSAPIDNYIALIKAIVGLGIALEMFDYEERYSPFGVPNKYSYIHRINDGEYISVRRYLHDDDFAKGLDGLKINDFEGKFESEDKIIGWWKKQLPKMNTVLDNRDKATRILMASQWLFDGYCVRDEILGFVQTMVAMEVLLGEQGESDITGLGSLLANRCAYLISKSHSQRRLILEDFKKIYQIRSKIVHSGQAKLNLEERARLHQLRWMCRRVIREEMDLLKMDVGE